MREQQQDKPYGLLALILAVLSSSFTVPAMRRVIQDAAVAGHGVALAIANEALIKLFLTELNCQHREYV